MCSCQDITGLTVGGGPYGSSPPLRSPGWVSWSGRRRFPRGRIPPSCLRSWPPSGPSDDGRSSEPPSHHRQRHSHCPVTLPSVEEGHTLSVRNTDEWNNILNSLSLLLELSNNSDFSGEDTSSSHFGSEAKMAPWPISVPGGS